MKRRLAKTIVATLILIGMAYLLGFGWGRGGRGFFSPDTLETKTQSEILLPIVNVPLYRSSFRHHRYELVDYLVANGYWSPTSDPNPPWIVAFQWNDQWRDGCAQFHKEFNRLAKWSKWSEDNAEFAAILWPRVLAVFRSGEDGAGEVAWYAMWYADGSASIDEFEQRITNDPDLPSWCKPLIVPGGHDAKQQ